MFIFNDGTSESSTSGAVKLNFLWKDPELPFYVMDNHRAALWCWLTELAEDDPYTLVHLDFHWDGARMTPGDSDKLRAAWPLSIEDYGSLREDVFGHPLVRWDNYICPLLNLRNNVKAAHLVAHQDEDILTQDIKSHPMSTSTEWRRSSIKCKTS